MLRLFQRKEAWRGSVYKLVWQNLAIWLALYYIIALWYRQGMGVHWRPKFEYICRYCDKYIDLIPLSFVLGFYVNLVIGRWWTMWDLLPWPDNAAFYVASSFPGSDEKSRILRRTVVRYINCSSVHTKCLLSQRVRRRFPTMEHFVSAGLLTEPERKIIETLSEKHKKLYYVPLLWATLIMTRAKEDKLVSELQWKSCVDMIVDYRNRCSRSLHIEIVNIPLVYSQVIILSLRIQNMRHFLLWGILVSFISLKAFGTRVFDWEDIKGSAQSHLCPNNASFCAGRDEELLGSPNNMLDGDFDMTPCFCDMECLRYGDCCVDFAAQHWGNGDEHLSDSHACLPLQEDLDTVFMVSKCPLSYNSEDMSSKCSRSPGIPNEDYTYLLDLPVYSNTSKHLYANFYCAICHGEDLKELWRWNMTLACMTNVVGYSPEEFMASAEYTRGTLGWTRRFWNNSG
ncbi:unnamed protein product [Notodromas monacha]|uniref:Bestrophin homolog n=1 Tax=Notodromas monacha TaxID=399045 RepID=A0A7R9BYJ8_9CRUS|nr:unnamed protein product [Notodromas monacha]CAG0922804.1 unnamed protein product [Notodromas monacha]